jgi:hypothetical protein
MATIVLNHLKFGLEGQYIYYIEMKK